MLFIIDAKFTTSEFTLCNQQTINQLQVGINYLIYAQSFPKN